MLKIFGKRLSDHKICFAVDKKHKVFGGNFKINWNNFCCHRQKDASHTVFMNGNCMINIFSTKSFNLNLV